MRKKILVMIALCVSAIQLNASAAVIDNVIETDLGDNETKMLTISGQVPVNSKKLSGCEVTLRVYEKDSKDTSFIEYMDQITTDKDGKYSCEYIKSSESGDYRIEVNYALSDAAPEYIVYSYLSPKLFKQFFDDLNEVLEKKNNSDYNAPTELYNVLLKYSQMNAVNIEKMNEMTEKGLDVTPVTQYMLTINEYKDINSVIEAFNDGYVINCLNTATKDNFDALLKETFISKELDLNEEIYSTYENNEKDGIITKLASGKYGTIDEFKSRFNDEVLVCAMSGKPWQALYNVLKNNNTVIGIDFSKYNSLRDSQKDTVMKNFSERTASINGTVSCKEAFDKAVESAKNTGSNGGGSPSSGGGSTSTGIKITGKDDKKTYNVIDTTTAIGITRNDSSDRFSDMTGYEWAKEAVDYLAKYGFVKGDGNGHFRPGDYVTRAEFVKMIIEATKMSNAPDGNVEFCDVDSSAWYKGYVKKAVGAGIITGITENEFAPDIKIKRADAAVISIRVLKYFGQEYTPKNIAYTDVVENYAFDSIYSVAEAGIMTGVGNNRFEPERGLTRAEAAKIVYNISKSKGDFVE